MGGDDQEEVQVKGMAAAAAQAEAGLKLFKEEVASVLDTEGATAYKKEIDDQMAALQAEAAALTGKDNKKARTEKEKAASALKNDKKYIDACKVLKGLDPPNGNFAQKPKAAEPEKPAVAAAEEEKKDDKKEAKKKEPKKTESAGISPA